MSTAAGTSNSKGKKLDISSWFNDGDYRCIRCFKFVKNRKYDCAKDNHPIVTKEDFSAIEEKKRESKRYGTKMFPRGHNKGDLIVTTDARFNKTCAAFGVVIRDFELNFIANRVEVLERNDYNETNHVAEAEAVLLGLVIAKELMKNNPGIYQNIKLYSDSRVVVEGFNTGKTKFPEFDRKSPNLITLKIINKLRAEAGEIAWMDENVPKAEVQYINREYTGKIQIKHIRREINQVADLVCKSTRKNVDLFEEIEGVSDLMEEDKWITRYYDPEKNKNRK